MDVFAMQLDELNDFANLRHVSADMLEELFDTLVEQQILDAQFTIANASFTLGTQVAIRQDLQDNMESQGRAHVKSLERFHTPPKRYIWRIWSWNSNDRDEVARIATKGVDEDSEFEIVQQFLVKEFIKPEFRSKVELTERGFEWDDKTPEECLNYGMKPKEGESPCENCDGCLMGYEIDFVGREGVDYGTEPELRLINGTNSFYDLTDPKQPVKAADWNSLLRRAHDKSPEHGIAALIVLETPHAAVDPKYLAECRKKLKEVES